MTINELALCVVCGDMKSQTEFYRSLLRLDRTAGQCKTCTCARVKRRRLENLEAVRAYDRRRSTLPHRIANATRVTREWRQKHRDRALAQTRAGWATKHGSLNAPAHCEMCGLKKRLEKHHPDYSKPLLVVWLCKPCHAIADKIRRRLEAS